jgi:preprotein translocase subunit SecE
MSAWGSVKDWFRRIPTFLAEVKSEMKKVSYPSREEVMGTTGVVIATSIVFALYLWAADVIIVQIFKMVGS